MAVGLALLLCTGCEPGAAPVSTSIPGESSAPDRDGAESGADSTGADSTVAGARVMPSPAELLIDPDARLTGVSMASADPDQAVALWTACSGRCRHAAHAVVLSTDGFRTKKVVGLTADAGLTSAWAVGDSRFVVRTSARGLALLDASGRRLGLGDPEITDPVALGEVVVPFGQGYVAVDPERRTTHFITGARGALELFQQGGSLQGFWPHGYGWSDDGGRQWHRRPLSDPRGLYSFVDSAPDQHVLVRSSDGATLLPLIGLDRLQGDHWVGSRGPVDPLAFVSGGALLPDGSVAVAVTGWSDAPRTGRFVTEPGIYVTDGIDWTSWRRADTGAPDGSPHFEADVLATRVDAGGATFVVRGADQTAWRTSDLGRTWQPLAVR